MNLGFKKLPILLSLLFFLASCAVLVFLYKQIDNVKKETDELEKSWQTESDKRKEMKTLDKSLKLIEEDKKVLDSYFAYSTDIVPFLNTLEKLSESVGAKGEVSSVDILKDNTGLEVNLKATGSFGSLYKLLQLFENAPYEIEILGVDLEKETLSNEATSIFGWRGLFKLKLVSFIK